MKKIIILVNLIKKRNIVDSDIKIMSKYLNLTEKMKKHSHKTVPLMKIKNLFKFKNLDNI
jgi:hypothetical protein